MSHNGQEILDCSLLFQFEVSCKMIASWLRYAPYRLLPPYSFLDSSCCLKLSILGLCGALRLADTHELGRGSASPDQEQTPMPQSCRATWSTRCQAIEPTCAPFRRLDLRTMPYLDPESTQDSQMRFLCILSDSR